MSLVGTSVKRNVRTVELPSHLRIFVTSPYGCHISVKVHGLLRSGRFYERFTSNYCIKPTLPVRYKHVLTGENRALTGENVY